MGAPWIGFDLDGTLAQYDGWAGPTEIGEPIWKMIYVVKAIIDTPVHGIEVKIMTARVSVPEQADECRAAIQDWCERHIGARLEVVCCKDLDMLLLYDDRAITVEKNTGRILTAPQAGVVALGNSFRKPDED